MTPREVTGKTRGQNGVASPFLWGSIIPYNVPVYPGALRPRVRPREGVMICPVSERPTATAEELCFQSPSNPYRDLHT
jgi:hypothetical protein